MLLICGVFVNGPYGLITTAVSADLGSHQSLRGNSKALATVTAIIDGTGSMGAALGPLLTGIISKYFSWQAVFYMLILANCLAMLVSVCLRACAYFLTGDCAHVVCARTSVHYICIMFPSDTIDIVCTCNQYVKAANV